MTTKLPSSRKPYAHLDQPRSYQGLDPAGMLCFAVNFSSQVAHAAEIGAAFAPPGDLGGPKHIVLAGMGGSAVAGDFLARLCEKTLPVPFAVCRNYCIPRFVSRDTLFIASSHSGNTEETLEATGQAYRRKARILCITTGGALSEFARRRGLPLLTIPQSSPPMPPRAALGYSFIPLVSVLGRVGLYPGARRQIGETITLLEAMRQRLGPDTPERSNQAKQLARALFGKIPWVHGTVGIMSAAAYRWRCQFNENSKTLAYSSEYPELNHNEVVGWEIAPRLARDTAVIVLKEPNAQPRIEARVAITREIMSKRAEVRVVEAEGDSPLARVLWTLYLADFVSIYLAFLNGADPTAIAAINELKSRLAEL